MKFSEAGVGRGLAVRRVGRDGVEGVVAADVEEGVIAAAVEMAEGGRRAGAADARW